MNMNEPNYTIRRLSFIETVQSMKFVYAFYGIIVFSMASLVIVNAYPNWQTIAGTSLVALTFLAFVYWWIYKNIDQVMVHFVKADLIGFANTYDLVLDQKFKTLGYHFAIYGQYNGYSIQMDLRYESKGLLNQYYFTAAAFIDESVKVDASTQALLKKDNIELLAYFACLDRKILLQSGHDLKADLLAALNYLTASLQQHKIAALPLSAGKEQ